MSLLLALVGEEPPIPPEPPVVEAVLGGGVKLRSYYQYKYKAEEKTVERLERIDPRMAEAIAEQAIAVVSNEASQAQAQRALERAGIAYKQAYQEIFMQLVAEMRQAQEDEQIAFIVASLL